MDLIDYLDHNQDKGEGGDPWHEELLSDIVHRPGILKIDGYRNVYREVELRDSEEIIGAVDLIFISSNERPYIVEGKVVRSQAEQAVIWAKNKMNKQLRRARTFFLTNFDVLPITVGVYRILGKREINRYFLPPSPEQINYSLSSFK